MKNFMKTAVAALVGGLIAIGTYTAIDKDKPLALTTHPVSYASPVNYVASENVATNVDFSIAAERVTPSVVHIKSTVNAPAASRQNQIPPIFRDFFGDDFFGGQGNRGMGMRPRVGSGSGVIISNDGYIITNNHVIKDAAKLEVVLNDNRSYEATIIGTDPNTDLALIKIDEKNLPAILLGNSDEIRVGQWVLAVGNPFNLNSTVTAGIVSAKGRNINIINEKSAIESFIQTDAAINPGNSGGALVNLRGELVGINTAIASPTGAYSGYGFAVPVNIAGKIVEDLMEFGRVQRAMLGVSIRESTSELAREKGFEFKNGVYVESVGEGSAAAEAGIMPGDVIVKLDGKNIKSVSQLQEAIGRHRPGDKVEVHINRDEKENSLAVTLKNATGGSGMIEAPRSEISSALGAEFETLSDEDLKELGIAGGVKVSRLFPGKIKSQTGIRNGFIITKLNNKNIKSANQLLSELEKAEGGVLIEGIYPANVKEKIYYGLGVTMD